MKTKRRKRAEVKRPRKKTTRVTVDFPTDQHRRLKALAALEGVTLQDYIRKRITTPEVEGNDIPDSQLKPLVKKILEENKDALKRLADK